MKDTTEWDVRSEVKQVVGFGESMAYSSVVSEVCENLEDVDQDAVESEIQEMVKDGTVFKPDQNSLERT